jgi:hypothetical protein
MQGNEPGPRAQHLEQPIEPTPGEALMKVTQDDGLRIGLDELEAGEVLAKRRRRCQMKPSNAIAFEEAESRRGWREKVLWIEDDAHRP